MIGSLVPLTSFFFLNVPTALLITLIVSALVLFALGFYKAKITIGKPWKEGAQMTAIGMLAALAGHDAARK